MCHILTQVTEDRVSLKESSNVVLLYHILKLLSQEWPLMTKSSVSIYVLCLLTNLTTVYDKL